MASRHPILVLALAAMLLLAPSLMLGTLPSHSSPQNLTWSSQFADQFRAGVLYPRWLPDSFDGLGGPAFYFYPPLPFWIDALASAVTFGALPVSYRLSLAALLLLWASGLAMRAWLARETDGSRAALVGAVVYMAAPYHLLDHYIRGAYAEFAAYAFLPLVVLGIRQVADRRRGGPVVLALSYAALLMSHLPTALLASVTLIPFYVLFRAWRMGDAKAAAGVLIRSSVAGALGVGLAAIYLLPALQLQGWISAEQLWADSYLIENWFLLTPERWREPTYMMKQIAWFAAAWGIAAAGVLLLLRRAASPAGRWSEAAFWALLALGCLVLISGLVPWFWRLVPFVAKVQFPWRLMVVVEFAAITALCLAPSANRSRVAALVYAAAIAVLIPGVASMLQGIAVRSVLAWDHNYAPAQDAKEYLPSGYPHRPGSTYVDLALEPLTTVPLIDCAPAAKVCRAEKGRFGTLQIRVEGDTPTTVTLRRFFFPAWRIDGMAELVPAGKLRLVSFVAPAGRNSFRLERGALPVERWGWAASGLSLVLLLAWVVLLGYISRRDPTKPRF